MPTSLRFAAGQFKNGSDPYSLYQTLTRGYGMMAPQTWMVPRQKYDVIHYLRETYLKPHNPSQYAKIDDGLPRQAAEGHDRSARRPSNVEPWVTMDYGPSLMNTYEVGGPAAEHRLQGHRRPARRRSRAASRAASAGRSSITTRCASPRRGAATGSSTGKAFTSTASIRSIRSSTANVQVANPVGPGWANPETGSFDDPRLQGPRRPALRAAAAELGAVPRAPTTSATRPIISYTVGDASDPRTAGAEIDPKNRTRSSSRGRWRSASRRTTCSPGSPRRTSAVGGRRRRASVAGAAATGFTLLKIPAAARRRRASRC